MEPLNEQELDHLLRQWDAPAAAPPHLERRIFSPGAARVPSRWVRLFTGSIRVPVPALAVLLVTLAIAWFVVKTQRQQPSFPAATPAELKLSDFEPVAEIKPRVIRRYRQ